MSVIDNDIDILAKSSVKKADKFVIAPDAPILPTLSSQCECELAVDDNGIAMVLYTRPLSDGIEWVEYDVDLSMLTFVTWSGKVMGLGMKVHAPFRKYLKAAKEILLIEMGKDRSTMQSVYPAELIVRHVGI